MKKFAKGEQLLAADLNTLAVGLEELQAAPRGKAGSMRGHVTYGHAWYNVTGTDGTALNAPGVLAGVCYVSGIDEPCIEDGIMKLLPPSGGGGGGECSCVLAQYNNSNVDDVAGKLAGVQYTSGIDEPRVTDGMMALPLAEYIPTEGTTAVDGHAGGIAGVKYGSSIDEPRISGGVIELVAPVVEQYTESVPDDGEDGWILSAYLPMIMASDGSGDLLLSFKQLMRIHNGKLQVNFQRAEAPTGAWENYFGS